jgi:hypothetical protein
MARARGDAATVAVGWDDVAFCVDRRSGYVLPRCAQIMAVIDVRALAPVIAYARR